MTVYDWCIIALVLDFGILIVNLYYLIKNDRRISAMQKEIEISGGNF